MSTTDLVCQLLALTLDYMPLTSHSDLLNVISSPIQMTGTHTKDTSSLKTFLCLCMGLLYGRLYDIQSMYLDDVTDNILYHSFMGGTCTMNHMIVNFVTHDVVEQDDS